MKSYMWLRGSYAGDMLLISHVILIGLLLVRIMIGKTIVK